jgi:TRAP-type C4-dicarboxylate transport system substrate-binding protein
MAKTQTVGRRRFIAGAGAAAGMLAAGRAPAFAQNAAPKKLVYAHIVPEPESAAVAFAWMAQELGKRAKGALEMEFAGGTLLTKELEIMNAVKAGNVAVGDPAGAAATIFPEMGVFLVPYLVRSYDQAYRLFNGKVGDALDKQFQAKYGVKVLCFFDYGFRHFWNTRRPIVEPKDLRGMKLRGQGLRRHRERARRQRRADALGRGHSRGAKRRHRRRRSPDHQHPRAQGL